MSYLSRLREFQEKSQVEELPKLPKAPFVSFDSVVSSRIPAIPEIPPEIAMGLSRLRGMRVPRITRPDVWPEIVADALRLSSEGWAVSALGLGWSPLELWGWSPDREGLAVWLAGRPLVLIDDTMAIVRDCDKRCVFHRQDSQGARFLWELPLPYHHERKFHGAAIGTPKG